MRHPWRTKHVSSDQERQCLVMLYDLSEKRDGRRVAAASSSVQCCFTSTETVRTITIEDGEPRTATSIFTQLLISNIEQVQCSFTSTETIRSIRDGEPRTATSIFTQLLNSDTEQVQCSFTSTETIRSIRDEEPRTAASTFTQLLGSETIDVRSMLPYVHRHHNDY